MLSSSAIQNHIHRAQKAYFQLAACIYRHVCVLPFMEWKTGLCHLHPPKCSNVSKERLQKGFFNCLSGTPNTAAIIALGWNCPHSVSTIRKLRFLHRVMTNETSICHGAFSAMVDDVETLKINYHKCKKIITRRINCYCYVRSPSISEYIRSLRESGLGSCTGLWPLSHQKPRESDRPTLTTHTENVLCVIQPTSTNQSWTNTSSPSTQKQQLLEHSS